MTTEEGLQLNGKKDTIECRRFEVHPLGEEDQLIVTTCKNATDQLVGGTCKSPLAQPHFYLPHT